MPHSSYPFNPRQAPTVSSFPFHNGTVEFLIDNAVPPMEEGFQDYETEVDAWAPAGWQPLTGAATATGRLVIPRDSLIDDVGAIPERLRCRARRRFWDGSVSEWSTYYEVQSLFEVPTLASGAQGEDFAEIQQAGVLPRGAVAIRYFRDGAPIFTGQATTYTDHYPDPYDAQGNPVSYSYTAAFVYPPNTQGPVSGAIITGPGGTGTPWLAKGGDETSGVYTLTNGGYWSIRSGAATGGTYADYTYSGINTNTTTYTIGSGATKVESGDFCITSDARLKDNIETIPGALDQVCQMRGVYFGMGGADRCGVVAQEMQAVEPRVVNTADDEQQTLSVSYGSLAGHFIEAIKELTEQNRQLMARIEALEARNGPPD